MSEKTQHEELDAAFLTILLGLHEALLHLDWMTLDSAQLTVHVLHGGVDAGGGLRECRNATLLVHVADHDLRLRIVGRACGCGHLDRLR